ncbi:hypothetical protein [Xanthomonas phage RTH11]|nr:hypothetical protein [Xanthomonas phage RTH11]
MSNKLKTLIITNAVAIRLLDIAGNSGILHHDVHGTHDEGVDGLSISHEHPEHGPQVMRADRISENYFNVTFTGSPDYLKSIGVNGWTSSIETLFQYLGNVDRRLLGLTEEFVSVASENIVLFSTNDEVFGAQEGVHELELLLHPISTAVDALLEGAAEEVAEIVQPAAEELLRIAESAVQEDEIRAEEAQADPAPEAEQVAAETTVAGFGQKVRKFISSPWGVAVGTLAVTSLVAGGICLLRNKAGVDSIPEA